MGDDAPLRGCSERLRPEHVSFHQVMSVTSLGLRVGVSIDEMAVAGMARASGKHQLHTRSLAVQGREQLAVEALR
jgi:hypothetical protein